MDKKKLALIHIIKRDLNLSDEAYRDILHRAAGVDSAKDLDDAGFRRLMNRFVRSRHYRVNARGMTLRQKMLIQSLARDLGWDAGHLNHFIGKYYHQPDLYHLSRREAAKLIESLKHVSGRQPQTKRKE